MYKKENDNRKVFKSLPWQMNYSSSESTSSAHSCFAASISASEMFEAWAAPSSETLACFLNREINIMSALVKYRLNIDSPSTLEHMPEESRDNICLTCFLLKICDTFEVGTVFGLIGRSGERDVDVFTCDPLVEIIFDLKEVTVLWDGSNLNEIPNILTYHRQHKSDGNHRKWIILRKFRVNDTIVFFVLEPNLIDNGLYERGTKYSCFWNGILSTKLQNISSITIEQGQQFTL